MGLAPTSYLICKRLGFRDLGHVPFFTAVLDPAAIVGRRWGRLAGGLASPVGAALRIVRSRRRDRRRYRSRRGPRDWADYDDLWDRVRGGFAACVRRDAAYVQWRYRDAPHRAYQVLEARRTGALAGFIVACEEDHRGLRLGWIVDVFAAPDDAAAHEALIGGAIQRFLQSGVARVQAFTQNERLGRALLQYGFAHAASRSRLCVRANGAVGDAILPAGRLAHRSRRQRLRSLTAIFVMREINPDLIKAHTAVRFRSEYDYALFEYYRSAKVIAFLERAGVALAGRVLDCGCGGGGMPLSLAEHADEVVGIDPFDRFRDAGVTLARERGVSNLRFARADGMALPFKSGAFDLVLVARRHRARIGRAPVPEGMPACDDRRRAVLPVNCAVPVVRGRAPAAVARSNPAPPDRGTTSRIPDIPMARSTSALDAQGTRVREHVHPQRRSVAS